MTIQVLIATMNQTDYLLLDRMKKTKTNEAFLASMNAGSAADM